jgi:hypothetical protein
MARLFADGFEGGFLNMDTWWVGGYTNPTSPGASTTHKFSGNYSLVVGSYQTAGHVFSPVSTLYFAFKFYMTNNPNPQKLPGFDCIGRNQLWGAITSGIYYFYRRNYPANTDTLLAQSSKQTLGQDVWHKLHGKIVISDTVGEVKIYINDVLEIDFDGNTLGDQSTIDNFYFYINSMTAWSMWYDDVVLDDSDWIGDTRIQGIVPDGVGSANELTPSTVVDNWTCVDEVPPSETDYVGTVNATTKKDLYTASDIVGPIGDIVSVSLYSRVARWGDTGIVKKMRHVIKTDGEEFRGTDVDIPSNAVTVSKYDLWQENPDTVAPWEEAEVNALEIGVEVSV